ncbi:MAG: hypothetical protein NT003_02945 [Candidatus Magasanikbacteria bacterium]|nr:hypothetical protein [Candidatus Magasanikbacteria bacterium]
MAHELFKHRIHPEEVARRQRWVAVGITILMFLIVATWFSSLPTRLADATGASKSAGWKSWFGDMPKATYIDSEALLNTKANEKSDAEMIKALKDAFPANAAAAASTTIATSTSVMATTSTNKK